MGSQILKCHMSKKITLQFTSEIQCSVRIHKIAGPNPGPFSRRLEMSLCQPSSGWVPFLGYRGKWGSKEWEKERNWLCISYALSKKHWASDPHCPLQPLGYAGSLDLYLSSRRCNSRFLCAQLFNTTLPSFLNNWNLFNGAQNSLHLAIMGRTERTWVVRIYAHKIGAYLQRLRLDCAGAQAETSFCWPHTPNKTRFLVTIYDLVLQWQGKEDWFFNCRWMWAY